MKKHKSTYSHQWKACQSMNRRKESYNLLMGEETKTQVVRFTFPFPFLSRLHFLIRQFTRNQEVLQGKETRKGMNNTLQHISSILAPYRPTQLHFSNTLNTSAIITSQLIFKYFQQRLFEKIPLTTIQSSWTCQKQTFQVTSKEG